MERNIQNEPVIAVLSGGVGEEREVSLATGRAVAATLERTHRVELLEINEATAPENLDGGSMVVFPAIHGTFGEDGELQSLLDDRGIEYAGSGVLSSRLCMDKQRTKSIVESAGVSVPPSVVFEDWGFVDVENVIDRFGPDLVVKPLDQGSSVSLSLIEGADELRDAIKVLPRGNWMIEQRVFGRELTVGVLHGQSLGVVEIIPKGGVYDYDAKYLPGSSEYRYPAIIPNEMEIEVRRAAEKAFAVCGCRDFARIDFIATQDGPWHFLEVNTIPGLTETSLLPKSASCAGYDFDRLVNELVAPTIKRFQTKDFVPERN
ncbi:MAG: D-alanine--D-alanine ligase [Opitutales bacterium]|jgi:D-alanine-D-alanine ligase